METGQTANYAMPAGRISQQHDDHAWLHNVLEKIRRSNSVRSRSAMPMIFQELITITWADLSTCS